MKLHFRLLGAGKPVIILHGLFGSSDNWQSFSLRLANEGFLVVLPDLRNHGRSSHSEEHTYEAMAEDLRELIEAENLEPAVLMGHSMGGKAAMLLALNYPRLVSQIIVVDISPGDNTGDHIDVVDALAEMDVKSLASRNEADKLLSARVADPATRQFLLKNLYRSEGPSFDWRFNLRTLKREINNMRLPVVANAPFSKPALFVRGEKSAYIDEQGVQEIRLLFTMAQIVTAPGAGHWVHVDAPDWLLVQVKDFLRLG